LLIKTEPLAFDGYKIDDFELIGYDPHPAIKAEMAI
jgi:thymidylate synthase